ncbi:unnamed protein product [Brachionus calyciflorus]|uniref:Delta-1-pyrroline-5-carboxylate synthase n=1 Tax=Brachionus calyciflorus TaxID=104777 RepID=A0A813M6H8_9BILA|nr:unnamed protein product [Brachionus calyciflorus]
MSRLALSTAKSISYRNFDRKFSLSSSLLKAYNNRNDLKNAKKVVVKLGSAVITREDQSGIALGRLASIVEQVSELQNSGKQVLMVTSGAVALGRQKVSRELLDKTLRESTQKTITKIEKSTLDKKACAATGQNGLMSLYSSLFSQYGVETAQVLVTKADFQSEHTLKHLQSTLNYLLEAKIVPILNTNDAIGYPPELTKDKEGALNINDNDSLAAKLAAMVESDLLLIMSDVNGVYNCPPSEPDSRLLENFCPSVDKNLVSFGSISNVGTGGMESKIAAAEFALENNCSVIICNGKQQNAILDSLNGKKIGTFFSNSVSSMATVENLASNARNGGRLLQTLSADKRSKIIRDYAQLLLANSRQIYEANTLDIELARKNNLSPVLLSRLSLNEKKLITLADGMQQIAANTNILGKVLKSTQLADELILKQVTVPIGVLLVIFESRPDSLPQIASLCIASGNSLLLKGGSEAFNTNKLLHKLVQDALEQFVPRETISLLNTREEINDLLQLDSKYIDLIIPRGSNQLVQNIQKNSKSIPVLGHAEGICHVFVDKDCDPDTVLKVVRDAKCDYPSACNAMETLLIHKDLVNTQLFESIINLFKSERVKLYAGPSLQKYVTDLPPAKKLNHEYSDLELTIEVADNLESAVDHINKFGSNHTESIITKNDDAAEYFLKNVDSACVFLNTSTRMADGYRFGLGAEVGISTGRLHARGPVGVEGLLTTKWLINGNAHTASDFSTGKKKFIHKVLN